MKTKKDAAPGAERDAQRSDQQAGAYPTGVHHARLTFRDFLDLLGGALSVPYPKAGEILGCRSAKTIARLVGDGELDSVLIRGKRNVPVDSLFSYYERQRNAPTPPSTAEQMLRARQARRQKS